MDPADWKLKPLSKDAIPAAIAKAERYRMLNEASEAESICRDVLAIAPEQQEALRILLLALTDQFPHQLAVAHQKARELLPRLQTEYDRAYYEGIVHERYAKAQLRRATPEAGSIAHDALRRAMQQYERAERLRPAGNDDALLRWNTCVRILARHPELRPADPHELPPAPLMLE
jgi:hypothetical protein